MNKIDNDWISGVGSDRSINCATTTTANSVSIVNRIARSNDKVGRKVVVSEGLSDHLEGTFHWV